MLPTEIYPTAKPVSSLGAQFSTTLALSIGPSCMPPPPLPPVLSAIPLTTVVSSASVTPLLTTIQKKEEVNKEVSPLKLPPPPQPPSFGSFDRLPTKICMFK